MAQSRHGNTYGAERGLSRFEGFSDAVFAIALTLLIVEIKVPGSPDGPNGYSDLARAMAEQWREHLALVLCYVVIGAYWLQHHYSGRIYAKSDHWFGAINLLFLLAIVVIPYPIRIWCFHMGTRFEPQASVTLVVALALTACTWMGKWFYGMTGRRVMDERLAPDFLRQILEARFDRVACQFTGHGDHGLPGVAVQHVSLRRQLRPRGVCGSPAG